MRKSVLMLPTSSTRTLTLLHPGPRPRAEAMRGQWVSKSGAGVEPQTRKRPTDSGQR